MRTIVRFWRGEEPLWKAFVVLGLLVNFSIGFTVGLLFQLRPDDPLFVWGVAAVALVIAVYAWVGQWRCAFNTKHLFLGAILRTWLVVTVVLGLAAVSPSLAGSLLGLAILFCVLYYVLAPVRDYVRLLLYKYRQPKDRKS